MFATLIISHNFMYHRKIKKKINKYEFKTCFVQDSNSSTGMDCGFFENTCVTGEIEVAFGYNNRTSCLEITIKACKNLMIGDTKKKCHP